MSWFLATPGHQQVGYSLNKMSRSFFLINLLWSSDTFMRWWSNHHWFRFNGLLPGRRQAIIWTNVGILLFGPLGINFSEIAFEILTCSFKKMWLKVLSAKWRLYCLGLNVLKVGWTRISRNDAHIPVPFQCSVCDNGFTLKNLRHYIHSFPYVKFDANSLTFCKMPNISVTHAYFTNTVVNVNKWNETS